MSYVYRYETQSKISREQDELSRHSIKPLPPVYSEAYLQPQSTSQLVPYFQQPQSTSQLVPYIQKPICSHNQLASQSLLFNSIFVATINQPASPLYPEAYLQPQSSSQPVPYIQKPICSHKSTIQPVPSIRYPLAFIDSLILPSLALSKHRQPLPTIDSRV